MALRGLIGAVGLSAVLGIFALLQRDLDEWSAKTLGTTLFVSAAALLIMANAAGLEKRSVGMIPGHTFRGWQDRLFYRFKKPLPTVLSKLSWAPLKLERLSN